MTSGGDSAGAGSRPSASVSVSAPGGGAADAPQRHPRSIVVSASGWVVCAMAVLGLAGGLVLGWTELLVIGVFAVVVAVVSSVFLLGRIVGRIDIAVRDREVTAGAAASVVVRVRNESGRRQRAHLADFVVGERTESIRLPAVGPGESHEIVIAVPTSRRGVIELGPVTVLRRDPLGLARRESVRSGTAELFVHPATVPVGVSTTGLLRDLEGIPTADLTDSDMSFHALRAYLPGDDRRHIHWKSTAKTGSFLVRQFEQTRRSHLIVMQSLSAADYASEEEFELAVSVTASIGVRAVTDGTAVSVFAGVPARPSAGVGRGRMLRAGAAGGAGRAGRAGTADRSGARGAGRPRSGALAGPSARGAQTGAAGHPGRLRTRTPRQLLDDLSRITESSSAATARVTALARAVGESAPDASVVFLACGSTVTARQLRAAASHFAAGVEVVAVVVEPEAEAALVRIDALRITRIGYLDDLVRILSRAVGA